MPIPRRIPRTKGKLPIRLGDKAWIGCWLMKEITLPRRLTEEAVDFGAGIDHQ